MVTQNTDIEMKEDLEFSDSKEEAMYWRQLAEEYAEKLVSFLWWSFNEHTWLVKYVWPTPQAQWDQP